jgi:hypothetical protein
VQENNRYRTLFPYKLALMPNFFRHTAMSRIQNLGLFEEPQKFFRGPQKQERKNGHNSIMFGAKNKARSNFI